MADLEVHGNQLSYAGKTYRCVVGKHGVTRDKKEGDGCTPMGAFFLRECWYRPDRLDAPKTRLPLHIIQKDDGWCDDAKSPDYNRRIKLPFTASHEKLWRDDHAYDLVIPLSYNDDPPVAGKGSAIFLHVMHDSGRATEGCVALAKADLLELLPQLSQNSVIEIR